MSYVRKFKTKVSTVPVTAGFKHQLDTAIKRALSKKTRKAAELTKAVQKINDLSPKLKAAKRPKKIPHAEGRMKVYVCRDGTRTCAAVMSPSHLAFSIGAMLRTSKSGEERMYPTTRREGADEFVSIFLKELVEREKAGTLIEPPTTPVSNKLFEEDEDEDA